MLSELQKHITGEILTDEKYRLLYATDASAYREIPLGVVYPKTEQDLVEIVKYASQTKTPLIPRTAGTSLAGQVVGNGLVVDVSKHLNKILEVNVEEKWVRVQPGVVLDELNLYLKQYGLFFGPETSTANRCMIGGMVGNNACGAHSLVYGSTRDHLLEVKSVLHDGSIANFKELSKDEFLEKAKYNNAEGEIYSSVHNLLKKEGLIEEIESNYPHKDIERRNTGYALDLLVDCDVFKNSKQKFNMCKLLAGSEGTLCFFSEIKLNLVDTPPVHKRLICAHFNSLEEALDANLVILRHQPVAIELMDDAILKCTEQNIEQQKNRFFLKGEPGAILIIELAEHTSEKLSTKASAIIENLQKAKLGYHFPEVEGKDITKVWNLRKAGLGVLSNMPGDAKPVSVIEDTAVLPSDLPSYIADFKEILNKRNLECVFHAHIATGELHLRPVLNLKQEKDRIAFREVAAEVVHLVKKYKGSLSGEHGDGRLRGEFIKTMLGASIYEACVEMKSIWDRDNIFNPGKIVDTPIMNETLRYEKDVPFTYPTMFRYAEGNALQLAEKCNGSGDCRKPAILGGGLCPSYQASMNETETTRARANLLREYLTNSKKDNPFNQKELYEILDLCISCKACKNECPSGVDMAKLKAEFLHHYYKNNKIPLRSRIFANITSLSRQVVPVRSLFNFFNSLSFVKLLLHWFIGISKNRSLPKVSKPLATRESTIGNTEAVDLVLLVDEFTNYLDTKIGRDAIELLEKLGYSFKILPIDDSGRASFSKGMLTKAKQCANTNVSLLSKNQFTEKPIVGIEPSAILSFRDEYPYIVDVDLVEHAKELANRCFTIEEFLANEIDGGRLSQEFFTNENATILYHGHCQQKAVSSVAHALILLNFPKNYIASSIQSGCCGMAGSFGYEKEHYQFSMKIGELHLFPAIRKANSKTIIAASGTSCRHQISDGTGKQAQHPVSVLLEAIH
jgi:FAD/FMN-containing dehydrogenase/Fe-S oxidoreductase